MVLENSSLKGIFGQNMSYPPKWSLTDDSRLLQAAVLKELMRQLSEKNGRENLYGKESLRSSEKKSVRNSSDFDWDECWLL